MRIYDVYFLYFKLILFLNLLHFTVNGREQCYNTFSSSNSVDVNSGKQSKKQVCHNVKGVEHLLTRKKRALLFPTGTRFLITASLVKAILVGIPLGWNVALELDVFYNMDSEEDIVKDNINFIKLHHRQRRDVWDHLEEVLRLYGMSGQPCVLRAICEAQKYLAPKDTSLVHDLLKLIFSAPATMDGPSDAYTEAHSIQDCAVFHDDCPVSILQIILSYQRT